ncbi:hypothetical protein COCNU_contig69115463G000010 [Cocos nucifera]|nr:hypothetical protein [Cocos nucifera]
MDDSICFSASLFRRSISAHARLLSSSIACAAEAAASAASAVSVNLSAITFIVESLARRSLASCCSSSSFTRRVSC